MRKLLLGLALAFVYLHAAAQNTPHIHPSKVFAGDIVMPKTNAMAELTPTKFVVAYANPGVNGRVATVTNDSNITYGPVVYFNESTPNAMDIKRLSPTSFLFLMVPYDHNDPTIMKVGTVSGNNITFGPSFVLDNDRIFNFDISVLSDSRFLVAYQASSAEGECVLGEINASKEISLLSKAPFDVSYSQAVPTFISMDTLSSGKFVICSGYFDGKILVGTIDQSNKVSLTNSVVFNTNETYYITLATLDNSRFAIAFSETFSSRKGMIAVGTISGSSVSFGNKKSLEVNMSEGHELVKLNKDNVVWAFTNNSYFIVVNTKISGSAITFSPNAIVLEQSIVSHGESPMVKLTDSTFAIVYYNDVDQNGKVAIGNIKTPRKATVGIAEIEGAFAGIYPNPAHDRIYIKPGGFTNTSSLSITDVSGRQVYRIKDASSLTSIDVSGLKRGVYFVHILSGDKTFTRKLVLH
jgi:hypothetical protein